MYKKIFYPLLASSILFFASCNNEEKTEETATTTDTTTETAAVTTMPSANEGKSVDITMDEVPDSVRTSFSTKYPAVTKTSWVRYEPIDWDDMNMDDTYYYVRYNNDGADYVSWYNNRGDWVKTSTMMQGSSKLPAAVNQTITSQYPGYEIEEVSKENDKDKDMYEIKLNKGEAKAKLKVLPDGTVFKRTEKN